MRQKYKHTNTGKIGISALEQTVVEPLGGLNRFCVHTILTLVPSLPMIKTRQCT